jgi:hypothetical protein
MVHVSTAQCETTSAELVSTKTSLKTSEDAARTAQASLQDTQQTVATLQKAQQGQNIMVEEQGEALKQAQAKLETLEKETDDAKKVSWWVSEKVR